MKIAIALPAYNEEKILKDNVLKLLEFCRNNLADDWRIIIADNGSADQTAAIAKDLAQDFSAVKFIAAGQRGKGAAIRAAWEQSEADIYCFMDADLATDLTGLPELIGGIKAGHDLVLGSRFLAASKVSRSLIRKLTSQIYRLILKILLGLKINDAPCGFKAISHKIKEKVLPQVKNNGWFFDSELVILTEKQGYKIKEIPVIWRDPREGLDKSKVKTFSLGWEYLKQVIRLRNRTRIGTNKTD